MCGFSRPGFGLVTGALDAYSVTGMRLVTRAAAAAAAAGVASFAYQTIAEARDRRRFPPPGRLVDIGGRRLHLVTAGEGSPAVVIIPALGESVLGWLHVLQGAAAETQACVYDRAEIGWSDPPPHWRRTPDIMAADLHALLFAAGIPAPYVLVGHSIGGIVARRFYAQHPGMVAGMLLVDSSHEQQVQAVRCSGAGAGVLSGMPGWRHGVRPGYWASAGSPPRLAWCGDSTPTSPARCCPRMPGHIARSCCRRATGGWRCGKCSWRACMGASRRDSAPFR